MRHAALLNPFNLKQERSLKQETPRLVGVRATRSTPVCSICSSDDIISHATAQWSNETQEWELADTFNQPAHCKSCNRPCDVVWLTMG
jgi:hypothetical protein